jgi:hypothetical protein
LTFRQNYQLTFLPTVPPFAARICRVVWTWRCLAAKVGKSKTTGRLRVHNKPIDCGASGAYSLGPDNEEEEEATCKLGKFHRKYDPIINI